MIAQFLQFFWSLDFFVSHQLKNIYFFGHQKKFLVTSFDFFIFLFSDSQFLECRMRIIYFLKINKVNNFTINQIFFICQCIFLNQFTQKKLYKKSIIFHSKNLNRILKYNSWQKVKKKQKKILQIDWIFAIQLIQPIT